MEIAAKKTNGRQKIEIKRIENEDDRLITFSKRKSRTYNKASELVTLTGAEIGHPSIEAVANRFLEQTRRQMTTLLLVEAQRQVRIDELNQLHGDLLANWMGRRRGETS